MRHNITQIDIQTITRQAFDDWEAGKFSNEFYAKLVERDISDIQVERALRSRSSGICRYRHRGQPRYGFWHPASQLFIVWRPAEEGYESEYKTCFYVRSGMAYMRGLEDVEILRFPGRVN